MATAGGEAMGRVCDVGDARQIAATVAEPVERLGARDLLVNNAQSFGTARQPAPTPVLTPLERFAARAWERPFATAPPATYHFMKAAFPHLTTSRPELALHSGSDLSQVATERSDDYNTAKTT